MENSFSEWIEKAEEDWAAAKVLWSSKKLLGNPVLFHCQQAAEKYLKAFLIKNKVSFAKTHDLLNLLTEVEKIEPLSSMLYNDLEFLNEYAVITRYPGDYVEPNREEVVNAISCSKRVRFFFRRALHLNKSTRNKKK